MAPNTIGENIEATEATYAQKAKAAHLAKKRDAERAEYLAGMPVRVAAIDALLTPIEAIATAIDEGLEKFADERDEKEAAARKRLQFVYVTPDEGELPQDWAGIRAHVEVAPLIADGWKLTSVQFDFAGRRVAELSRERAT